MSNIRKQFGCLKGNPTWGELDYTNWLPTGVEFAINFYLLDGVWPEYVKAGTIKELVLPQLHCWTGQQCRITNYQSLHMMHKASWLLKDPTWLWLARQASYDLDKFRIGQSWWPDETLKPVPPTYAVNRIGNIPLQKTYWERAGKTIPLSEGSQFLTYRDTLDAGGDYLRLDVSWFCDRIAYHLATPDVVRIAGKILLDGLGSQVVVRKQGLLEAARTPMIAAVKGRAAGTAGAVMAFHVPNMSYSQWNRQVLHRRGLCSVFVDDIYPRNNGDYEVAINWKIDGTSENAEKTGNCIKAGEADVFHAGTSEVQTAKGSVNLITRKKKEGSKPIRIITLFAPAMDTVRDLVEIKKNCYAWAGNELLITGSGSYEQLDFNGGAVLVDEGALLAAGLNLLSCGKFNVSADKPVALSWDLATGKACFQTNEPARVTVGGKSHDLPVGETEFVITPPDQLRKLCSKLPKVSKEQTSSTKPTQSVDLGQKVDWPASLEPAIAWQHKVFPGINF